MQPRFVKVSFQRPARLWFARHLAPVELEGFAWGKRQGNEGAPTGGLGGFMLPLSPVTGKGGDPIVRSFVTQRDEIGMDLPQVATLLTPLAGFGLEPDRQLVGKGIQLAGTLAVGILGVDDPIVQVFADSVAGQPCAPGNLPNGHAVSQAPPPDYTQ